MKSHCLTLAVVAAVPMFASCAYLNTPIGPVETWPSFESRYDKYLVQFKIPVWPGEKKPCRLVPIPPRDFPTPAVELCYQPYDIAPDGVPEFDVRIVISQIPDEKGMDAESLVRDLRKVLKSHSEVERATLGGRPCIRVRHFTDPGKGILEREFCRLPLFGDRFFEVIAEYHRPNPVPEWVRSRRGIFEDIVRGIRITEIESGTK
ncbi:MAG: hypothetical protein A3K19_23060 [Lentisphaerae bacterium RIFOXYB12_FULL_65_16]|nr:MAG: hypothetical protein A3K18_14240 [Lentisphaerae bacterium RIFOXYA12_64_32]OGV84961.1 MAG: hypothetical protein A3K19_23060 [Lentisphaerae bacterium RIFOXYB12_FULL_65_16]